MTSRSVSVENLGPISNLNFSLDSYGVTVLVAPNGSGKSILLEAVQAAAVGTGKLPLKDRAKRGRVEAFGAIITIGGTCRHTGEFEVQHIEGKFDLAGLVDPRIKTASAADRARIKALVSLTGVAADSNLFKSHKGFDDFDAVVTSESIMTDDLVEMAAKIKDDYDKAALVKERTADKASGSVAALIPPADLDLDEECDAKILTLAYNEARDELTRLEEQQRLARSHAAKIEESQNLLSRLGDESLREQQKKMLDETEALRKSVASKTDTINVLRQQATVLQTEIANATALITNNEASLVAFNRQIALVDEAKATIAKTASESPDPKDIERAAADVELARQAVERGVKIRTALDNQEAAIKHKKAAADAKLKADIYRNAGKLTDEVLSDTIKCPQLRVESDGKSARLVTDTNRGKSIPYHDLSDGEKWTIAIDIGADQVGKDGLLVISQVGWEGIDGAHRIAIHEHAVQRQVYILTAEAASDPNATPEIIPKSLPAAESERKPMVLEHTGRYDAVTPEHVKVQNDGVASMKEHREADKAAEPTPPAKPPAKKKPLPPSPPAETFGDGDEIPF